MKCKISIDPKLQISSENIQLPHVVHVRGEFSEEMAEAFTASFNAAENTGQSVIPIVIDSYGGDIYALLSMMDIIQTASIPVATIALGKAMSAGMALLTCGTEGYRFASPNATIMMHTAQEANLSGDVDDVVAGTKELVRVNNKLFELMAKNCGKDKDYFHKVVEKTRGVDCYLSAKQAQRHNIINQIRIPEFLIDVRATITFK